MKITRTEGRESYEAYELSELKRALLAKIGRPKDALQSAWSAFAAQPSTFTFKELMRYVPAKEKKTWHQKAIEASEKGDLSSQIELWLDKKETNRLECYLKKPLISGFQSLPR